MKYSPVPTSKTPEIARAIDDGGHVLDWTSICKPPAHPDSAVQGVGPAPA
jgi:hypothetical protein